MQRKSVFDLRLATCDLRPRSQRGFTLVEMICVVLIIGLIVALATSRMDFLIPKYKLRGAAREVGAVLKQAKSRAVSTGHDIYVQIDLSKGQYWMLAPFPVLDADGKPKDPPELQYESVFRRRVHEGVEIVNVIIGHDQTVTQGKTLVRMSPFGMSSHVIVNLKGDEQPLALRLNGLTGELSFHERQMEGDELLEDRGD